MNENDFRTGAAPTGDGLRTISDEPGVIWLDSNNSASPALDVLGSRNGFHELAVEGCRNPIQPANLDHHGYYDIIVLNSTLTAAQAPVRNLVSHRGTTHTNGRDDSLVRSHKVVVMSWPVYAEILAPRSLMRSIRYFERSQPRLAANQNARNSRRCGLPRNQLLLAWSIQ